MMTQFIEVAKTIVTAPFPAILLTVVVCGLVWDELQERKSA